MARSISSDIIIPIIGGGKFIDEAPDNPNFEKFWSSGGRISGCMKDLYAVEGEWHIDADDLPEQFRDVADEIDEVFNKMSLGGAAVGAFNKEIMGN